MWFVRSAFFDAVFFLKKSGCPIIITILFFLSETFTIMFFDTLPRSGAIFAKYHNGTASDIVHVLTYILVMNPSSKK